MNTLPPKQPDITVITLVNDADLYAQMQRSLTRAGDDVAAQWVPIDADGEGLNAAQALNVGIDQAEAPWIVCAHQDVVFPAQWWAQAHAQLEQWRVQAGRYPAVAGLVGVRDNGAFRGAVVDPHGSCRWTPLPCTVCSIDEHVIILRAEAQLRFDPDTPGFHCYGADMAMHARSRGQDVIAIDAPVVHKSGGSLDASFTDSSRWLLRKWGASMQGVIPTCAANITDEQAAGPLRRLVTRSNRRISVYRRRLRGLLRPKCDPQVNDDSVNGHATGCQTRRRAA